MLTVPGNTCGNTCGHNPQVPRFFNAPSNKRPDILKSAQQNAEQFYSDPISYLPQLQFVNDSNNKQRSERREAIASALQVLLHYMDLSTLEIGTPTQSKILGIQLTFISNLTKFGLKRIYRALKDLSTANYIEIQFKRYKEFGKYLTIRKLKFYPRFFHHLNISNHRLETARHYKRKSIQKATAQTRQKVYLTKEERAVNIANVARLRHILEKGKVGKPRLQPSHLQELPSVSSRPPTHDPPPSLYRKRVAEKYTSAQRENWADRRLDYFQQVRASGLTFEEAKAKADEKFPPLA